MRTTETMSKRIVVVIMLEKADDEIGSLLVHSLHVHRFKEVCNSGAIIFTKMKDAVAGI